ncbi:hypothetical protein [Acidimangrovimonas pyrenivorans]|uniref:Uncharacterized protein n=1 Tax=Acidimangrovimonas pyrenivorans TaxID=2030798 RepID=A0ABV7AF64_9RHOB
MSIASSDRDAQEFEDRLDAVARGEKPERDFTDLTVGDGGQSLRRVEASLAELDDMIDETARERAGHEAAGEPTQDDDADFERVDHAPELTPYDKARERVYEAEIYRDAVEQGSDEWHQAMAELAEARRALKQEQERATDEGWRKRRATEEWRSGPGREVYNASRRKVRNKANKMTPRAVLDAMTPEERAQHRKDKNAEKQWRFAQRKRGKTDEQIEAELPGWWARRRAKTACP